MSQNDPPPEERPAAGWYVPEPARDAGVPARFSDYLAAEGIEPEVPRPRRRDPNAPRRLRLMTDDCTGIGLWPEMDWDDGEDEDDLPVPDGLRTRIQSWVDEYTRTIDPGLPLADPEEHDRRGYELSRELQAALGPTYLVEYVFETRQVRDAVRAEHKRRGT